MPFDALVGLQAALSEREERHSRVEKKELSEEDREEISVTIGRITRGSIVDVTFYLNGHYIQVQDKVVKLQQANKYIQLGQVKVYFDDIYKLIILEQNIN